MHGGPRQRPGRPQRHGVNRGAAIAQRFGVAHFPLAASQASQVHAVLPGQVPDLVERPNAFSFVGRIGDAVRKEQNVH